MPVLLTFCSMQVTFAYAAGPLAWSVIAFRNSLVFHSVDKVCPHPQLRHACLPTPGRCSDVRPHAILSPPATSPAPSFAFPLHARGPAQVLAFMPAFSHPLPLLLPLVLSSDMTGPDSPPPPPSACFPSPHNAEQQSLLPLRLSCSLSSANDACASAGNGWAPAEYDNGGLMPPQSWMEPQNMQPGLIAS